MRLAASASAPTIAEVPTTSVPVTPLDQRLRSLRAAAGTRLRTARELAACPALLIDDLLESASAVARAQDAQTPLRPGPTGPQA